MLTIHARNGLAARFSRSLGLLLGTVAIAMAATGAAAQTFPNKNIRLLTPYPPGGSTDTLARIVGPKLSQMLSVPVNVENMAGANGGIGLSFLAKAPPDGHTILITTASPIVINPHTFPNLPYDALKDFTHISLVATSESALLVNPKVPARNLKELVDLSKNTPVKIGVAGRGGQPELILEKINKDTGAKLIVVPYAGGGPAITDAVGGHVDGVLNDIAGNVKPMVETGRLRSVAVLTTGPKSVMLPDAQTLSAQGQPLHLHLRSWLVLLGPANMRPEVSERLRKAMSDIVADPEVISSLRQNSLLPYPSKSTPETKEFIEREWRIFRDIQRETGVKVE
jgi:tripartite-type tricarboxylate transporter receptor subunit TctC